VNRIASSPCDTRQETAMSLTVKYEPTGRFDASTSAQHQLALIDLLKDEVTALDIDFSNIEFLSSAGLRVLLFVAHEMEKRSGTLQVTGAKPEIKEIIEAVGFDDIVHLKD
jgi:anti-sigma B factor antagonist/stage II sporulation protein AA (anti-sigma F factor antagonist)